MYDPGGTYTQLIDCGAKQGEELIIINMGSYNT